jgi:hypothetical protein
VYQHFRAANLHMTETSVDRPDTDDVIPFSIEAPPSAILRDDLSAMEFLQFVQLVQHHWVLAGEAPDSRSPGLHHSRPQQANAVPVE